MSSGDESSLGPSSDSDTPGFSRPSPPSRPSRPQSRTSNTPGTPRKRRRIESVEPLRVRRYYLEGKYNDAYRVLFNQDVDRAAATRLEPLNLRQHYTAQYGASTWSGQEQAALFAALARFGKADLPAIAHAVGTKTVAETHDLLLLLAETAADKGTLGLTLRDIPAAIELGHACTEELDVMAEALAWYQEQWEVADEQARYGEYWLITPRIAADLETAIDPPSRPASTRPTTPADPDTPRSASGIAGSCLRCKRQKIRCDRQDPCSSCARLKKKVVCEYPQPKHRLRLDPPHDTPEDRPDELASPVESQLVHAIPQASLLHPENMLMLSRDLFMNRSPDIPSPWPHWSAYISDQVPEPSLMRTAFNDFHDLAVSITKRLMQTAIMQATSRLRSQRRRTKKGVMPFVKTRDVLSAIDILGLKRNGRSRWTGVARRCNLRVFEEQRTTKHRVKRREISWDEAESILGLYDAVTTSEADVVYNQNPASDPEDDQAFQRRAARHGTPMPMEHLTLSTSASDAEMEHDAEESDLASSDDDDDDDDEDHDAASLVKEDVVNGLTKAEPDIPPQDDTPAKQTLEQFDQEARQQEEESLCKLLGIAAPPKSEPSAKDDPEDDTDTDETLFTSVDDWRNWTQYRPAWEMYQTPISNAKFNVNQKPRPTLSAVRADLISDASSTASPSPQRSRVSRDGAVELQPQNPRSYAATQTPQNDAADSDPSTSDIDVDADVPTQSIEQTDNAHSIDAMDWET